MSPEFCDLWALKRFHANLEHPTHLRATDDWVPVPLPVGARRYADSHVGSRMLLGKNSRRDSWQQHRAS